MAYPNVIPQKLQDIFDEVNARTARERPRTGLPSRYILAHKPIPGIEIRYSTLTRTGTDNQVDQFIGDPRLGSHRLWAYLLYHGAASRPGEGAYEVEYERDFPGMLAPERLRTQAATNTSVAPIAPALVAPVLPASVLPASILPAPALVTPTLAGPALPAPTLAAPTLVADTLAAHTLAAPTLAAPILATPFLNIPATVTTTPAFHSGPAAYPTPALAPSIPPSTTPAATTPSVLAPTTPVLASSYEDTEMAGETADTHCYTYPDPEDLDPRTKNSFKPYFE